MVFRHEQAYIRRSIKHQIKAGIPEDELHFFGLSLKEYEDLEWERPNKEFRLGTRMFDVVRSEINGDSIRIFCVNDQEEALLFVHLDQILKKRMGEESNTPDSPINRVTKILKLVYLPGEYGFSMSTRILVNRTVFSEWTSFYSPPDLNLLTPPPDLV